MINDLLKKAIEARKNAYAPYSYFAVGAALLCEDGRVFTGCNIENCAYTPGVCAERVALFKAVSEGERSFKAIAVVGGHIGAEDVFPDQKEKLVATVPCGVCRQVLAEFCPPSLPIVTTDGKDTFQFTLGELFPKAFTLSDKE